ncbi:MAG TPA: ABC transporter permease [Ktedonobacterales bacterium]|nr:ABC transporter permease [Ktedonobacterales bacterium]
MATPTLERPADNQELPTAGFGERARQWALRVTPSLSAVLVGILMMTLTGSLLIMITAPAGLGFSDRFFITSSAYSLLLGGAVGGPVNIADTLDKMTPLVLAGFSVAVAFRAGLFNIGAGGQIAMGATVGTIVGLKFVAAPAWVLIPLVLLAGLVAGAIWGGIVGVLKAWRGAHEVVTTIMLNFVAYYISAYIVECTTDCLPGVGRIRVTFQPSSTPLGANANLPLLSQVVNQIFPGAIANDGAYLVNIGLFVALAGAVVYWFLMSRTTLGYEIRAVGQSPKAARYAGINVRRNITVTMLIAGAFAGVAGALMMMGPDLTHTFNDLTWKNDSTGFDAISVALLGLNGPIGVLLAGGLFAALSQGAGLMQADTTRLASNAVPSLPSSYAVHVELIQFSFQALVLFVIAGQIIPQFRTTLVRLFGSVLAGMRSSLARLPSLMLWLFVLADLVAAGAFIGFVITSLVALQPVVPLDASVSAINYVDPTPLFALLLTFYLAGILILLLTIGLRLLKNRLRQGSSPPLLIEAFSTEEVLSTVAAAAPETTPGPASNDSTEATS